MNALNFSEVENRVEKYGSILEKKIIQLIRDDFSLLKRIIHIARTNSCDKRSGFCKGCRLASLFSQTKFEDGEEHCPLWVIRDGREISSGAKKIIRYLI